MFVSQITGECGGLFYMLRNLISRGQHGMFLNLKWSHLAYYDYGDYGVWIYEPYIKSLLKFIKTHKVAQLALLFAGIGDAFIWFNILHIL